MFFLLLFPAGSVSLAGHVVLKKKTRVEPVNINFLLTASGPPVINDFSPGAKYIHTHTRTYVNI